MKLWDKGIPVNKQVEMFTVGRDRELDIKLFKVDIIATIAHAKMLSETGLITETEYLQIKEELNNIYVELASSFTIEEQYEDIHSKLEAMLTERIGDPGKKVHTARSRNDQVLTAIRIYLKDEIRWITNKTNDLFNVLIRKSETHRKDLMPGYTHMQVAMPSSFGLWFSAYAESLADDLIMLHAAYQICDMNPLGSAAGYGSSFPINRSRTTELLGFSQLSVNVINAQMGRGKTEKFAANGIAAIAATLSRLSMDCCTFLSQNYSFITLPDTYTTGSSIMPHKKNPDVFELIRAKCNRLQNLPNEVTMVTLNLGSGYHRDFQVLKEILFPALESLKECMEMTISAIHAVKPVPGIMNDEKYRHAFTVEDLNRLVITGVPFREAYRIIGSELMEGRYLPTESVEHSHEGSIGNLCLEMIKEKMNHVISSFRFEESEEALDSLLHGNSVVEGNNIK